MMFSFMQITTAYCISKKLFALEIRLEMYEIVDFFTWNPKKNDFFITLGKWIFWNFDIHIAANLMTRKMDFENLTIIL